MTTTLSDLNHDVLLHIFKFSTNRELRTLSNVCKRFQHLIEGYVLPQRCRDLLMTGTRNAANSAHHQRTLIRPSAAGRLRINDGWLSGRYAERTLFQHRIMYPSHIHLERNAFYMSHGGEIRRHRRLRTGLLQLDASSTIGSVKRPDVTCFRRRDRVVFGGRENGDCFVHDANEANAELYEERTLGADGGRSVGPVRAVDMRGDCFVTANRERLTVWTRGRELGSIVLEPVVDFDDEYKSVCVQPTAGGEWLACGKYRDRQRTALEVIHLERHVRRPLNSRTTAVYDLRWLDANTILTANYDSTCRLHDVRANRDVLTWMDPYDAAVYTLEHDGQFGVLAGMSANCRVNLYDVRQARTFVQMMYPHMERSERGSPVYGLCCDATQLFIATDHNLRVLDYTAFWARPRDYRDLFAESIVI